MKTIFILYGGKSVEHDISIITALQVYKTASKNYDCKLIYVDEKGKWWTGKNLSNPSIYVCFDKKCKKKKSVKPIFGDGCFLFGKKKVKPFAVVLCNHGLNGEDGSIASVMKLVGVPYASSSLLSSAVMMDKSFTKMILDQYSILNAEYYCIKKGEEISSANLEFPLIVKPANLGSSVGISVCRDEQSFNDAVSYAFEFDDKILVEKFLTEAREFNCACFRFKDKLYTSKVIEIRKNDFFTFEEKYLKEKNELLNEIEEDIVTQVENLTKMVYQVFECFGVVRIDYLYSHGKLYVNELNSIPGALSSYMFKENFDEILDLLIEESVDRFQKEQEKVSYFKSDALKLYEKLSGKIVVKK